MVNITVWEYKIGREKLLNCFFAIILFLLWLIGRVFRNETRIFEEVTKDIIFLQQSL